MSAYNEEAYVAEAMTSMLEQTYSDFEFIIIDDASTDKTKEIVLSFDDKRIVFLESSKNVGLTKNLNKALHTAKGKLVARMDANDIANKTRFEKQIAVFADSPKIDLVWTGATYITKNGEYLCSKLAVPFQEAINLLLSCPKDLPVGRNHINHMTVMFKKSTVMELGGYCEKFKWGQDGNLWCRMLKRNALFYFLEEELISIRLLFHGVTAQRSEVALLDENDYYSGVCKNNGNYSNALKWARKMPWGSRKLQRLAGILFHFGRTRFLS